MEVIWHEKPPPLLSHQSESSSGSASSCGGGNGNGSGIYGGCGEEGCNEKGCHGYKQGHELIDHDEIVTCSVYQV